MIFSNKLFETSNELLNSYMCVIFRRNNLKQRCGNASWVKLHVVVHGSFTKALKQN